MEWGETSNKPKLGDIEVGVLYDWKPKHFRDHSVVVLCLRIYTNWHSEDIGTFLELESLEELNIELPPNTLDIFTRLTENLVDSNEIA